MINFPITFGGVVRKHVMVLKPDNSAPSHEQKAEDRQDVKDHGSAPQVLTTSQYQQAGPETSPYGLFFHQK